MHFDTESFQTYGSLLFLHIAKVFKTLYEANEESENSRKDICIALSILFSSCLSAKTAAIEQNFLRKAIDVARDNATQIHIMTLAKMSKDK